MLGICNLFCDLVFEQLPRPWEGAREPTNDVSGTEHQIIFNPRLDGISQPRREPSHIDR